MTRLEDETAMEDFLRGANFLSASGGGEPTVERVLLLEDLREGLALEWSPIDPVSSAIYCTACFSGSIAPEVFEDSPEAAELAPGDRIRRPMVEAIRELEDYLGKEIAGLVSIEIGAINTGSILDAAARLGKHLVDGDYAGRAIPELHATTPHVYGVEVLPWAMVDQYGNRMVMRAAASDAFAERIGKFMAQASFGLVGCALVPLPAAEAARIFVPGTLTECLRLGKAIREARESGEDPVAAAAEAIEGWVLFRGRITKREWQNTGYLEGFHEVAGEGAHEGHTLRIWFKNENHLSWLDGEPFACSPDLIEVCNAETGEPLVNTYLKEGDRIAVVGRRRRDHFDSEAGLAALGPAHFGWPEVPFTPIEQLVGARP